MWRPNQNVKMQPWSLNLVTLKDSFQASWAPCPIHKMHLQRGQYPQRWLLWCTKIKSLAASQLHWKLAILIIYAMQMFQNSMKCQLARLWLFLLTQLQAIQLKLVHLWNLQRMILQLWQGKSTVTNELQTQGQTLRKLGNQGVIWLISVILRSSISAIHNRVKTKSLFVCHFSPNYLNGYWIFLNKQLKLSMLAWTTDKQCRANKLDWLLQFSTVLTIRSIVTGL